MSDEKAMMLAAVLIIAALCGVAPKCASLHNEKFKACVQAGGSWVNGGDCMGVRK